MTTQQAGRIIRDHGRGGAIVNMASTSISMTMPTIAAYAASKGSIASLTVATALALAPHGIRANSVGPGTIETDMTREKLLQDTEQRHKILSRTPLGVIDPGVQRGGVFSAQNTPEPHGHALHRLRQCPVKGYATLAHGSNIGTIYPPQVGTESVRSSNTASHCS